MSTRMIVKQQVLVNVRYWMPDYNNILQEFIWGTEDIVPEYPRVHKFLNYWHHEIDAVISQVYVSVVEDGDFKWRQIGHYNDNQIN